MTVPQLPGFRYVKPLGRGGYGEVFSAYQDRFDRWVAVKVLGFTLTDQRLQRQFVRECRLAGRLSAHPNIVTVYDSGIVTGGRPYITMELFADGSIADALRSQGPFPVPDALRIGIALAGALETAHGAGVVHRDVKPANVLLATYGQPALTDFGLSVVTERHEVSAGVDALTPYHAAPEVLERTAATPVSDVYSLASTLYAMLTGRAPHQGSDDSPESIAALLLRVLQRDVPPLDRPDAPPSLRAVLDRALARDPATRTPTARAFAADLQAVQRDLGVEITNPVVIAVPGTAEAPAPPDSTPTPGLVLPPPPPAPPPPTPTSGAAGPPTTTPPPALPGPAPVAVPTADSDAGGADRPPLPSRTPNRAAAPAPAARGNGDGDSSGTAATAEPSLDQLAALERALLGQPPSTSPPALPERPRRPPPAPLRRRPDTPAPPSPPPALPLPAPPPADVLAAPSSPPEAPAPAPPPPSAHPPAVPPAPVAPAASVPAAPSMPPEAPVPPGWPGEDETGLPEWVTAAMGGRAEVVGFSDEPEGDTTIERAAVRGYLPPSPVAPAEHADRPRQRERALPILVGLVIVAALAAGVVFALVPRDGGDPGPDERSDEPGTPSTTLAVPAGLTAVESPAGVQLDWEGDESEVYAVLMMPEKADAQVLPAETGTSMLVPATRLADDDAYCFAVAYLAGLEAASPSSEAAFGPPACIRGASEDTVRPG